MTIISLIKRGDRFLSLTSFGAIVIYGKQKIDKAIDEYYNLKTVDSIERTIEIDRQVKRDLINNFVNDEYIKKVVLGEQSPRLIIFSPPISNPRILTDSFIFCET